MVDCVVIQVGKCLFTCVNIKGEGMLLNYLVI